MSMISTIMLKMNPTYVTQTNDDEDGYNNHNLNN